MFARPIDGSSDDTAATRGALRLSRGIIATWWYTCTAVICFQLLVIVMWGGSLATAGTPRGPLLVVLGGGVVWCVSTVPLLAAYRHRTESEPIARWRRVFPCLAIALGFGAAATVLTGVWGFLLVPVAQSALLLNWPPGLRLRLTIAVGVVLAAVWAVDAHTTFGAREVIPASDWMPMVYISVLLPLVSVLSLWWWDILITVDRARASEAKLAATQERLRMATDVHDLQGHHLQVIALQLELAERLMARDPNAALEHLRTSRASVAEAQQGTRDLAARFRSVPLRDELANAADLLRAAGNHTELVIERDAEFAVAEVLGPVIRETTTNVLRHGAGTWASLSLTRAGDSWRYEISNAVSPDGEPSRHRPGAGLSGLARRADDAGGALEIHEGDGRFTVTITVPPDEDGSR